MLTAERDLPHRSARVLRRPGPGDDRRPGDARSGSTATTTPPRPRTRTWPASSWSCSPWVTAALSEADVKQAARALTGWKLDRQTGEATLRPKQHDDGSKTVLGRTGDLGAEELVDVLLGQPASADFVVGRLWFRLVGPQPPSAATRGSLLAAYGTEPRPQRRVAGDRPVPGAARPGDLAGQAAGRVDRRHGPRARASVPSSAARPAKRSAQADPAKRSVTAVPQALRAGRSGPAERPGARSLVRCAGSGQIPFRPPSVGGWPAGGAWLTTAAAAARLSRRPAARRRRRT